MKFGFTLAFGLPLVLAMLSSSALGHHTLGINPAGKATSSPQIPIAFETQVEHFLVSLAVLPEHPAVNQPTRLIAYVKDTQTLKPFLGELGIRVAGSGWFGDNDPLLNAKKQPIDDRYIEIFQFPESGTYSIRLEFSAGGRNFAHSFSLQVGDPVVDWKTLFGVLFAVAVGAVIWRARKRRARPRPV